MRNTRLVIIGLACVYGMIVLMGPIGLVFVLIVGLVTITKAALDYLRGK